MNCGASRMKRYRSDTFAAQSARNPTTNSPYFLFHNCQLPA